MIFTGQNVTISMLDDDGEWIDIGAGVFQPQMPMEKPPVINFWKPPVVRQTEPFWVKKWRRNR